MRMYVIHVHGMKSALAYIQRMALSAAALKLETSARVRDIETIRAETPAFLNALRAVIRELEVM